MPTSVPVVSSDRYAGGNMMIELPTMPTGHLFEFCSRDYWQSLDTDQLIGWIRIVSWHLEEPKYDSVFGIFPIIREVDVDLTNSGRILADFKGKRFAEANLYEFLCWASQRLVWLSQGRCMMPTSVPIVFEELMDSKYWEQVSKDDKRLSQWLMVVGIAINFPHDNLEEIIEDSELEKEMIVPCQAISTLSDERENDDNFEEDESTCLGVFADKEYDLRKKKHLTRSSLLDLAVWCIARLRENEQVKSPEQFFQCDIGQEMMRSS